MYSIDPNSISLQQFYDLFTSREPLPSRRPLLEGLAEFVAQLTEQGITSVGAVLQQLKSKKRLPVVAEAWGRSEAYLTLLNRELKSYLPKVVPLARLNYLTEDELSTLAALGVCKSDQLYDRALTVAAREALAGECAIAIDRLVRAVALLDLMRINGVGPQYAAMLCDCGAIGVAAIKGRSSQELLAEYELQNSDGRYGKVKLREADFAYCKYFAALLDEDIELA